MTAEEKSVKNREYYLKNRERILKYQHQYYLDNKDAEAKRKKDWYERKKAKADAYDKLVAENAALKAKLAEKPTEPTAPRA